MSDGRFFNRLVFLVAVLAGGLSLRGEAGVRLPVVFSDGMVLQHGRPVAIWGWADAGEEVRVSVAGRSATVVAGSDGRWLATLDALPAGGPYTLVVNDLAVEDVLAGDVWFCSGQSNMELPVSRVTDMFAGEVALYENPSVRHIKVPAVSDMYGPHDDIAPARWTRLEHDNVMDFSALCYFFARELYEATGVPVGIINASLGGSPIEAWLDGENIKQFPRNYNDLLFSADERFTGAAGELSGIVSSRWYGTLEERDPGLTDNLQWHSPALDDSAWRSCDLFDRAWSDGPDGTVPGSFWLRKKIAVPDSLAGREAILRLGCIMHSDRTYVNGRQVGETGYEYPPRIYTVPAGVLTAGENLVTVRVVAPHGNAHFIPDKPYKLLFPSGYEIPLEGLWQVAAGAPMPAMPQLPSFSQKPTTLYNGMVAPIARYTVRGAVWYQGETNAGRPAEYYGLLKSLIAQYRRDAGEPDLPVLVVQLPNFMQEDRLPGHGGWAFMRETQLRVSQEVPGVGLAVTIDAGEWNDIHPLDKKTIAGRLVLQARRIAYGEDIVADGPQFESLAADGDRLTISFRDGTDDLDDSAPLLGFAVAGPDGRFHWAEAVADGRRVVVRSEAVAGPVAVRYAWGNNPAGANLRNRSGIPASPFRAEIR